MRREAAAAAALSAIDIKGAAPEVTGILEGDAVSTGTVVFSTPSGLVFDVTANSASWAAWRTTN